MHKFSVSAIIRTCKKNQTTDSSQTVHIYQNCEFPIPVRLETNVNCHKNTLHKKKYMYI